MAKPKELGARQSAKQGGGQAGSGVGLAAAVFGLSYLVWRWGWSWRGGSSADVVWWLAAPALVIETLGFIASVLLIWALAGGTGAHRAPRVGDDPGADPDTAAEADPGSGGDVDVVVFAAARAPVDVRATLVALRLDADAPPAVIVDSQHRCDVETLVAEFAGTYVIADQSDASGLAAALEASTRSFIVLLTAGDVPTVGIASSLRARADDDSVAAVQAVIAAPNGDSAEHAPNGRHDMFFERVSLDPSLGRRGAAMLTGSGSLLRRSALARIDLPSGNRSEVLWTLTSRFASMGMRVVPASAQPLVTQKSLSSTVAVGADRTERVRAAWRLIVGDDGALRGLDVGTTTRLSMMAWAVRPLESVRRVVFTIVVLGSLLSGRVPFDANPLAIFGLWAPAFLLTSFALVLLSGGSLRPGDRLRSSLRSVRVSLPLLVGINSVLVVRGISDRFTHAMRSMDQSAQVGLVVVALWVLAGCLDSLRLLARGRHARRAARLRASTTGLFGDDAVHVADVTMLGAGLIADRPIELGTRLPLSFSMSSDSGITSLEVLAVVRNLHLDESRAWRIGVEFERVDGYSLDTLAECCVVLPSRAVLTGDPRPQLGAIEFEDEDAEDQVASRLALRVATLLALAAVISSAAPLGAVASGPHARTVDGYVVDAADVGRSTDTTTETITSDSTFSDTTFGDTTITDTVTNSVSSSVPGTSTDDSGDVAPARTSPGSADAQVDSTITSQTTVVPPAVTATDGGLAGITVVAACSVDPGGDGRFGSDDDVYGPSVSTTTDDDGHYSLILDGEACWVSIAPPLPKTATAVLPLAEQTADPPMTRPLVVDLSDESSRSLPMIAVARTTVAPSSSPSRPPPPTASIADRIWADLDGDGRQQAVEAGVSDATVTLYDQAGHPLQTTATDSTGSFVFDRLAAGLYSVGVTNLPLGLRPPNAEVLDSRSALLTIRAGQHVTTGGIGVVRLETARSSMIAGVLPEPRVDELRTSGSDSGSDIVVTVVLILMASVLAASVLFASATPIRVRRPTSR